MIPFAAGSSLDIVGRIVMDPVSSQLGQPIVIENRGGAGGTIGTALVAKADPDGYTILVQASAHSAAPAAYSNIGYDVAKDFIAVIPFGTLPNVTVVSPASGIKTLKELVAKAKCGHRSPTRRPAPAAPRTGPPSASASRAASRARMCRSAAARTR